jgi:esterase/lipase
MKFQKYLLVLIALPLLIFAQVAQGQLKPKKAYKTTPDKVKMAYETIRVDAPGEVTLNAWYFKCPTKETNNYLLMCHDGNGNMGDYLDRVSRFVNCGYNVFFFDYRGYGASTDFEIDEKMYTYGQFCDDFIAMIEHIKKTKVGSCYVYGWGIGGAIALGVGYHRKEVKGIAADAPFTSLIAIQKKLKKNNIDVDIPDPGYEKIYEPIYALDSPPQQSLKKIYVTYGQADPVIGETEMKELKAKQKAVLYLFPVPNVTNDETFSTDKDKYVQDICKYFAS